MYYRENAYVTRKQITRRSCIIVQVLRFYLSDRHFKTCATLSSNSNSESFHIVFHVILEQIVHQFCGDNKTIFNTDRRINDLDDDRPRRQNKITDTA